MPGLRKKVLVVCFVAGLLPVGGCALPPVRSDFFPRDETILPASAQLIFSDAIYGAEKLNGKTESTKENPAAEDAPEHIRDNGFLVEEAVNQEAGVVQHIFNWIHLWGSSPAGRTRDFAFSYTMELPLGSQKHQFSFTTQFLTTFESPDSQRGDVGDTFLNYRYQLLANDAFLWCAPRATLILPTGDKRLGLGTGELGYQFNLPISKYGEQFDGHFNAGATYIPGVSMPLAAGFVSPEFDLRGVNLGASVYWKPRTFLHFFVETLALWNEKIDEFGFRDHTTLLFVNPGVRWAIRQFDDVEWVVGVSAPIGLTRDTPDIGVFAYMSIEYAFRKIPKNGAEK